MFVSNFTSKIYLFIYSSASEFVTLTVPFRTVAYPIVIFFWSVAFKCVPVYRTVPFSIFFLKVRSHPLEALAFTVF